MSHEERDEKVSAFEAALAALVPLPGRIDRDRLLFRAGQASVDRHGGLTHSSPGWLWPVTSAVGGLVAGVLGTLLLLPPSPTRDLANHQEARDKTAMLASKEPNPDGPGRRERDQAVPEAGARQPRWEGSLTQSGSVRGEPIHPPGGPGNYLQIREFVLSHGFDALPPPDPKTADSMNDRPHDRRALLKHLLEI